MQSGVIQILYTLLSRFSFLMASLVIGALNTRLDEEQDLSK
jgi:hypothetical protein